MTFSYSELRARVLDPTLDREQRLLAFWTLSAAHWRQRMHRMMSAEPHDLEDEDKIVRARRSYDRRVMLREKEARIANGSKRVRKVYGTMHATEIGDSFHSHRCAYCNTPFSPNKPSGRPQLYCSPACKSAVWRMRKFLKDEAA